MSEQVSLSTDCTEEEAMSELIASLEDALAKAKANKLLGVVISFIDDENNGTTNLAGNSHVLGHVINHTNFQYATLLNAAGKMPDDVYEEIKKRFEAVEAKCGGHTTTETTVAFPATRPINRTLH